MSDVPRIRPPEAIPPTHPLRPSREVGREPRRPRPDARKPRRPAHDGGEPERESNPETTGSPTVDPARDDEQDDEAPSLPHVDLRV